MQDTSTHNEQHDAFSEKTRSMLEHYEVPVDNKCWKEINQQLNPRSGMMHGLRPWLVGAAIVAVAAIIIYAVLSSSDNGKSSDNIIIENETIIGQEKISTDNNTYDFQYDQQNNHEVLNEANTIDDNIASKPLIIPDDLSKKDAAKQILSDPIPDNTYKPDNIAVGKPQNDIPSGSEPIILPTDGQTESNTRNVNERRKQVLPYDKPIHSQKSTDKNTSPPDILPTGQDKTNATSLPMKDFVSDSDDTSAVHLIEDVHNVEIDDAKQNETIIE